MLQPWLDGPGGRGPRWVSSLGSAAATSAGGARRRAAGISGRYVHTGNPVYPFFRHVFGGAGLDEVLDPIKRPMAVTLWNLLTALGPMTLQPDRFDSFSHQFGPVFLLFLPALLWSGPAQACSGWSSLGYAFLTLCLTQRQSMRFVLIARRADVGRRGLAGVPTGGTARPSPRGCWSALLVAVLGLEAGLAVARARHGLGVVLGRESRRSFLARREPTYRVGRWVERHLPATARLVGQDHRGFYIPRALHDGAGPPPPDRPGRARRVGRRGRRAPPEGRVHPRPALPAGARGRPSSSTRPSAGCSPPGWRAEQPLYREDLADADGVVRRYCDLRAPRSTGRRP